MYIYIEICYFKDTKQPEGFLYTYCEGGGGEGVWSVNLQSFLTKKVLQWWTSLHKTAIVVAMLMVAFKEIRKKSYRSD